MTATRFIDEHTACTVRAEGYCELGMYAEAWRELERIPMAQRSRASVLKLRVRTLIGFRRWAAAADLASVLFDDPEMALARVVCLLHQGKVEAARRSFFRIPQHVTSGERFQQLNELITA